MAITYNNLYLDIRRRLKQAGYPGAGLEARELVCAGSGKTREEFYRDAQLYVTPETEETVLQLVDRHLHGEPVAYLIGEWEFYGLPLDINESVLIPRVDTEVLAHEAIEYIQGLGKCRVLDLCAGSGCIGLALAANAPECRVLLGEISEGAVRVCRQNIRRNNLTGVASKEPVVVCRNCGRPLPQYPKRKQRKFCSEACRRAWWKLHPELIHKAAFYPATCAHCGQEFQSYGNRKRKYCSHACYIAARFQKGGTHDEGTV